MVTSTDSADSTRPSPLQGMAARAALALGLTALVLVAFLPLHSPEPRSSDAPATEFSAERAFEHVAALATEPHPVGSAAHARVRDDLVRRIEALGLDARSQDAVAFRPRGSSLRTAWVRNVLTRLDGSAGTDDAVLLVAHYDSVPAGPGAADDAAGVAALLETLRALRAGDPPVHDVIALFTDAEERGLLGAEAFLHEHPWVDDVRLVINLEARGAAGPSIMFETGPGTGGALLRRFARHDPRPLAASYSYDVYRRLPNDTDFTLFKARDVPGFNFAFIHDSAKYHSRFDTPENLSRASLQHHGDHVLSLARHFADADDLTDLPRSGPSTYFALPGIGLVIYPSSWALLFAGLVLLIVIALWVLGLRRGPLTVRGSLGAVLLTLVSVVVAVLVGGFLHRLLAGFLGATPDRLALPGIYLLGLILLVVGLVALGVLRFHHGTLADRLAGLAAVWSLLAVATALAIPSTSYLMTWPAAGLALALGVWSRSRTSPSDVTWIVVLLVAALPALWLWPPTLSLVGAAFGTAGIGPWVTAILAALTATLLLPQLQALAGFGRGRSRLPAILALVGLVTLAVSTLTAGHSPERPRASHLLYALDADTGDAYWASLDRRPSEWLRQFVGEDAEGRSMAPFVPATWPPLRTAAAPAAPLPPPEIELADLAQDDGTRRVRLTLESPMDGSLLRLLINSSSRIVGLRLADRELEISGVRNDDPIVLDVVALPAEGLPLEVALEGQGPLEIDAVDQAYGLPEIAGFPWEPRPDILMPSIFVPTDLRMVRKQFLFETTPPVASPEMEERRE